MLSFDFEIPGVADRCAGRGAHQRNIHIKLADEAARKPTLSEARSAMQRDIAARAIGTDR